MLPYPSSSLLSLPSPVLVSVLVPVAVAVAVAACPCPGCGEGELLEEVPDIGEKERRAERMLELRVQLGDGPAWLVVEQLDKLAQLRREGMLSDAEFTHIKQHALQQVGAGAEASRTPSGLAREKTILRIVRVAISAPGCAGATRPDALTARMASRNTGLGVARPIHGRIAARRAGPRFTAPLELEISLRSLQTLRSRSLSISRVRTVLR